MSLQQRQRSNPLRLALLICAYVQKAQEEEGEGAGEGAVEVEEVAARAVVGADGAAATMASHAPRYCDLEHMLCHAYSASLLLLPKASWLCATTVPPLCKC